MATSINIGIVYGKLTIIQDLGRINKIIYVIAECECGVIKKYRLNNLKSNNTTSCGCVRRNLSSLRLYKHGLSHNILYRVWSNMKERCYNKDNIGFKYYGGRGVVVCDEWKNNFKAFYDWSMGNWYRKGLQIDKDVIPKKLGIAALVYSPQMCCWTTPKVNCNSTRNNILLEYNGEIKTFSEWCDTYHLNYKLSHQRMSRQKMCLETLIRRFNGELLK